MSTETTVKYNVVNRNGNPTCGAWMTYETARRFCNSLSHSVNAPYTLYAIVTVSTTTEFPVDEEFVINERNPDA